MSLRTRFPLPRACDPRRTPRRRLKRKGIPCAFIPSFFARAPLEWLAHGLSASGRRRRGRAQGDRCAVPGPGSRDLGGARRGGRPRRGARTHARTRPARPLHACARRPGRTPGFPGPAECALRRDADRHGGRLDRRRRDARRRERLPREADPARDARAGARTRAAEPRRALRARPPARSSAWLLPRARPC